MNLIKTLNVNIEQVCVYNYETKNKNYKYKVKFNYLELYKQHTNFDLLL